AQRVLTERSSKEIWNKLWSLAVDEQVPRKARLHALWARASLEHRMEPEQFERLLADKDPSIRAWGVRCLGNAGRDFAPFGPNTLDKFRELTEKDTSPDVLLQIAIAARKVQPDGTHTLLRVLCRCGDDKLIPAIVWQNLHPILENKGEMF